MLRPRLVVLLCLLTCVALVSCDNVARVWDRTPGGGGGGGDEDAASAITVPANGQIFRSTRPSVELAAPTGTGLPGTTPVVVLFDEAMNPASVRASTGETPTHLYVRAQGTETAIPATYRFFLDGRCVVITPNTGLPNATYEVVVGRDVIDLDKQTVQGQGVVAEFTTNGTAEAGLRVVAVVPGDRERGVARASNVLACLSGLVDEGTVTDASFFVEDSSNTKVAGKIDFPVKVQSVNDTRFVLFIPTENLAAGETYRISVTNEIKAGTVKLDPVLRNPISQFTTATPLPPAAIAIGNPTVGFESGINRDNIASLDIDVNVTADTKAGDNVVVRVYGLDRTKTKNTRAFVAGSTKVATGGAGTVTVTLAGALGSLAAPEFKEGALSVVARIESGGDVTGVRRLDDVLLDVTPPTVTAFGPPGGATSFVTDLGFSALTGTANEELGKLELTVGAATLGLAGSDDSGRFWSQPVLLTRSMSGVAFAASVFDRAGNRSVSTVNGTIVQRGFLTGDVATAGTLRVRVHDEATLALVPGAKVIVEPGLPQKPAVGREIATTDASGEAVFASRTQPSYSVTIVADGYDLHTIVGTTASEISVPIRAVGRAPAKLTASLVFLAGSRSRVGCNLLEDETLDGSVATLTSSVRKLENANIRPGRPAFLSGFAGAFPPTAKPTYASGGTQIGAISSGRGRHAAPPLSPAAGQTLETTVGLLPATSQQTGDLFRNLAASYALDFSTAVGLDTGDLVETPRVSFLLTASGLPGVCYVGPGIASGGPPLYAIDGTFNAAALIDFSLQSPVLWSSVIAQDRAGNVTRNRAIFASTLLGLVTNLAPVAAIPSIVAPTGPFTGSPAVTFADRLDATAITSGLAVRVLQATDSAGRRWTRLGFDLDAASGNETAQFPDLAGAGVTGLATGNWSIRVEDRLIVSPGFTPGELVFEDLPRLEATWARARAVTHAVN